ncbi:response regulator [Paenibacillus aceris]|uniref:Two-component system response regulator YesN n=1 Tax=Paenibacillus aceris TaxID=869555 RepID=A0ABS4I8M9_9BACL|nr:response regulator [Paenibacillus aceris]MBP1967258.1 two-component system response regulator YesN [Paenibacillus aceris]NHW33548.1 response regulator [Paenibacillus aceris]
MQNILVVDDEAIQRRVLAKMIREARPNCQVLEAKNGQEALGVIQRDDIDIVFTDIKMPILDGLELIEEMNTSSHDIKVIILSGYRYFEYAQKAIQLGAFDYLVKPVKEESIAQILDKVESSIQKEKTNQLENEEIKQQLNRTLSVYYERLLSDWVTGGIAETQCAEIRQQFSLQSRGIVIVAKLNDESLLMDPLYSVERMKSDMLSGIEGRSSRIGPSVSFYSGEDKSVLITVLTMVQPFAEEMGTLTKLLKEFTAQTFEQFGMSLTIGIGEERSNLFQEARHSCKEALTAASFRYFLHTQDVIRYSEISGRIRTMHYDYLKEEELFKEFIRKTKSEQIVKHVDDWFERILENGMPYPDQWNKAVIRMVSGVASVIKDFVTDQDYKDILLEAETLLSASSDYAICKKRFLDTLLQFLDIILKSRSKKHESVIETCLHYLEMHYMEDLSLDRVANHLFFSPNYLSLMFKNHLGMTFSKYLTDMRIKKGIELLQNSTMKVYEIAPKVGFKDEKYFYRVFKSRFGVTPDEYRRNNHLHKKEVY